MFDRKVKKDMRLYGSKILDSKEFHEALQQKHHMRASVGRHSIRVTEASLRMSYALEKLGVKTDRESLVVGGLCHDLGMLGRKEKYKNASENCRQHPRYSVEMARRLAPELSDKTKNMIESHMFPLNGKAPNSLEGAILTVADKYVSVKDLIFGRK